MSDVKERVSKIVLNVCSHAVLASDEDFERSLSDIGVDSLDQMSVLLEVQEEFGIQIPDDDVDQLSTVRLISDYVESCLS